MADTKTVIEQAYSAFNKRDIDGALALMTQDVSCDLRNYLGSGAHLVILLICSQTR